MPFVKKLECWRTSLTAQSFRHSTNIDRIDRQDTDRNPLSRADMLSYDKNDAVAKFGA